MPIDPKSILRLNLPQWQGGNQPAYLVGSRILSAIAPPPTGPEETIYVEEAGADERPVENGIRSRAPLLRQLHAAAAAIARHSPAAIVTLGGDCLVDLAPIAYLSERYGDDLAVIWIDAHPDIMGPEQYENAHAHVLGNLMGKGDPAFTQVVTRPIKPEQVLYVGLNNPLPYEISFIEEQHLSFLTPQDLAQGSGPVIDWLKRQGKRHVAVHFDVDVLDARKYGFIYFNNPDVDPSVFDGIAQGQMEWAPVAAILADIEPHAQVVGLAIAEFMPWDMAKLSKRLKTLPLLNC